MKNETLRKNLKYSDETFTKLREAIPLRKGKGTKLFSSYLLGIK